MDNSKNYSTPKKSTRDNQKGDNVNEELGDNQPEFRRMHSEIRQQIEDKQIMMLQQKDIVTKTNLAWRFFQIINIFVSLLFGLGCLTLYPDIHLHSKKVFYLVVFYMAISIICFFFSLILMLIFWIGSKICANRQEQQQQSHVELPTVQNTNRSAANHDMQNSQANNLQQSSVVNLIVNNAENNNQVNISIDSEHSFAGFRQVNMNNGQLVLCNIGWFPLIYYSTLYIAYFFYLIFSTKVIIDTWKQIPLLISLFLAYIWIIGIMHVLTALALIFSRKFISRHIEEMEEAEVYVIDEAEINRRKKEILDARNRDIHNNNRY